VRTLVNNRRIPASSQRDGKWLLLHFPFPLALGSGSLVKVEVGDKQ